MNESGREPESLVAKIDWAFLVATAVAGAAMFVDIMLFEHLHMDTVGLIVFSLVFAAMLIAAIVDQRRH